MFNILSIFILITTFILTNCEYYSSLTNGKLVIHHNELTTEMKDHAIVTTIQAFDTSEDYNLVAKAITNVFDKQYGGVWNCLLANVNGSIFGFQLSYESGGYIVFSIGQVHVTLFKSRSENISNRELTEEEIINDSVKHLADDSYNFISNLDKAVELKVIQTIFDTLKSGSNAYQVLAKQIQNALNVKLGESWTVVIGRNDSFDYVRPSQSNGSLHLLIGKLSVLTQYIKCSTSAQKEKLTQKEVIQIARISTGVTYQGRLLVHNNDNGDGMYKEAQVYILDAIKTYDTYYDIAREIAANLTKKTVYNTLPTNWFVFVSDSANGVQYSPAGYAFIRIRYGPLEIAILKTEY